MQVEKREGANQDQGKTSRQSHTEYTRERLQDKTMTNYYRNSFTKTQRERNKPELQTKSKPETGITKD